MTSLSRKAAYMCQRATTTALVLVFSGLSHPHTHTHTHTQDSDGDMRLRRHGMAFHSIYHVYLPSWL
ncbi:hypothetical protein I7I50_10964 [Histoplasma capsulatum G186AR]|uniref:Uncharacterized protein n=1 Tax=Ajellomyces capsulatus TaxID=5037 RepID=A0A8H7Z4I3_AJECA|nr:hypothetical protein I7I52_02202 [Histoplasma capsulatum]QSS69613.1 hypothetical protein I7I50_10964 [Histoplasma capsulatum G186AR]